MNDIVQQISPQITLFNFIFASLGVLLFGSLLSILRHNHYLLGIPSPPHASWIWGHDKLVYEQDTGRAYGSWFQQLGPLIKIRGAFFHPDILVAADLDVIKHVLVTKTYNYHHSSVVRPRIERLLGRSLGWVEGAKEHRRMRRLVGPSLSAENVVSMGPLIYQAAEKVSDNLAKLVKLHDSKFVVNILEWTAKTTLEITGITSFNHSFNSGEDEDAQLIMSAWRRMVQVGTQPRGFRALMLLRRFPFLNHLPIKANRAHSIVKETIQNGVAKALVRLQTPEPTFNKYQSRDLLSSLVIAHKEQGLPKQELMDHISMFIMAGYETTSQTLSYTLWELAKHPSIQDRLRKEILEHSHEPTFNELQTSYPFLDAVFKESLRLHPGLPYLEREAAVDDVIPLRVPILKRNGDSIKNIRVAAGQIIVIPIIAVGRMNTVWTDGDVFRPERWLEPLPDESLLPGGWGNLLAFSDGPRHCVGYRLAIFQYKAILITLLKKFTFRDTGAEIGHKVASTLQPVIRNRASEGPQLPLEVSLLVHEAS